MPLPIVSGGLGGHRRPGRAPARSNDANGNIPCGEQRDLLLAATDEPPVSLCQLDAKNYTESDHQSVRPNSKVADADRVATWAGDAERDGRDTHGFRSQSSDCSAVTAPGFDLQGFRGVT